jgi:hypothetical protein
LHESAAGPTRKLVTQSEIAGHGRWYQCAAGLAEQESGAESRTESPASAALLFFAVRQHRAGFSPTICGRCRRVLGVVPNPTGTMRLCQCQLDISRAFAPGSRVGPDRVFTIRDGIRNFVFCPPHQLAAPVRLNRVVSNDSGVLNGCGHQNRFRLTGTMVIEGKQRCHEKCNEEQLYDPADICSPSTTSPGRTRC